MPARSLKQFRFMEAIANGQKPKNGKIGPSVEVAKEFVRRTSAEQKKQWSKK